MTGSPVSAVAAHPGASATNLFASQLEQADRGVLARVSRVASTVLLQSAAAGALSVVRALDPSTPSGAFVGPARFGQFRGRPELLEVYDCAKNSATAARLWQLTEEALGYRLPV
jgi:protochlorophyllide reductase